MLRYNTKKFLKTPITLFILVLLIISFSFSRPDLNRVYLISLISI
ncbi:hypothetical protein BVAVS116_E0057 (plasmid) [Borreliella valaisiana VS116]|uniref:Uncharacterized protein n=1 Tax=Borreliella valaisiana VS116 TaxID=445987 RepID=C0R8T8_BORVA|nr:hypothetical protein BVAVS116_E0057 [Borreliella valaisiana VS116]